MFRHVLLPYSDLNTKVPEIMNTHRYRVILLITEHPENPGLSYDALKSSGYEIIISNKIKDIQEIVSEVSPVLIIADIPGELENTIRFFETTDIKHFLIKVPFLVLAEDYVSSRNISGLEALIIKRPSSAQVFMDRIIPFIRLGQLTLNLEDAKNESEKRTEEKIKGYRLRINELDAMNQQLKALNQKISSEYSAASASNDILPPFLKLSPEVIAITRISDGRIIDVNDASERVTGYSKEEALETTTLRARLWVRPEDRVKMADSLIKDGRIHNFETVFRKKSGVIFPVLLSASAIVYENDPCIIITFMDISERRRTENLLKARIHLSEAASTGIMDEILKTTLNEAEKLTDSHIGFFHLFDEETATIALQTWSEATLKVCNDSARGQHYPLSQAGVWADCLRYNHPLIHNSYSSLPEKKGLPPGHVPILRELVLPISNGEETIAIMGVGNKAWDYEESDITALSELSKMAFDFINRILAEKALKESEERFRVIFENAAIGICQTDILGNFISVNSKFAEITGYFKSDLIGKSVADITHPEDRDSNLHIFRDLTSGDVRTLSYEKRYIHRSGATVWVNVSVASIKTNGSKPQYFIATIEDITARKKAEYSLKKERDFSSAILDTSGALIVVIDKDGRVASFNRKCEEVTGFTFNEIRNEALWDHLLISEELEQVKKIFCDLKNGNFPNSYENHWRTKKGELRYISWNNTCIVNNHGEVSYIIGAGIDITEKKAAERALLESEARLRQLNEELEQRVNERTVELEKARQAAESANKAKSSFLANMSHELRTPLNAILGFSQLMTHDPELSDKQRKNLNTINRSGEHLLQLINNVLDMAKIESGHTSLNTTFFDLYRLVDDISNMFRLPAMSKSIAFRIHSDPNVPRYISSDEGKIRQVLINLIGNAIKFTSKGEIRLSVSQSSVSLSSKSGGQTRQDNNFTYITFKIEDTGPGMSGDELSIIFKPFRQTSSGQNHVGGTGLGLSISRQFAQLMGGDLYPESQGHNLGATFIFEIPVILSESETMENRTIFSTDVIGKLPSNFKHRILIAEDVEANRNLLRDLLIHWELDVKMAANGKEALDLWEKWEPHLIFMDMRMPVMDGYEAMGIIRSDKSRKQPIIIALTASTFEEQKLVIFNKGADSFLSKPYRESEIAEQLERHLGVRFIYDAAFESIYDSHNEADQTNSLLDLSQMDKKWLYKLYKAASDADATEICRLAEIIKSDYPDIAVSLQNFSDNFDYEPVISAIDAVNK